VALVWSTKLGQIAKAIAIDGVKAPIGEPSSTLQEQLLEQAKANPNWLASASGARVWTDEKGMPIVLGFGSAPATSSVTIDRGRATLAARVAIQRFVAETVVGNEDLKERFTREQATDGRERTFDSGMYDNRVRAKSESLQLRGTAVVKDWFESHPIGNVKMQTVIVAWTPDSMAQARDLEKQMSIQERDMQGRGLVAEPKSAKPVKAQSKPTASPVLRGPTANPTRF
jgi:hypothetical protein